MVEARVLLTALTDCVDPDRWSSLVPQLHRLRISREKSDRVSMPETTGTARLQLRSWSPPSLHVIQSLEWETWRRTLSCVFVTVSGDCVMTGDGGKGGRNLMYVSDSAPDGVCFLEWLLIVWVFQWLISSPGSASGVWCVCGQMQNRRAS